MSTQTEKSADGGGNRRIVTQVSSLAEVVGAQHPVHIKKMSFLPSDGDGGDLARKAIATAEQLRAATGVDLADMARRIGGGRPATEPPPRR